MKIVKNWFRSVKERVIALRESNRLQAERGELLKDESGEAYIGEAIKILIAVVVGALVLALIYALLKDTVFPTVTQKIKDLFNYTA